MKKKLIISSLVFIIFIVLAAIGGYWYGLTKEKAPSSKVTQVVSVSKDEKIDLCIEVARKRYLDRWNWICKKNGTTEEVTVDGKSCRLPMDQVNYYDGELAKDKDFCLKRYK